MNNAEITRARPEVVIQLETLRQRSVPAVAEIPASESSGAAVSQETEAGLERLAKLIQLKKNNSKNRKGKYARAFDLYESIMNFKDKQRSGSHVNVAV